MTKGNLQLTEEEQTLLLHVLFQQNYASEILACELADIETGLKFADTVHYTKVTNLFNRLRDAEQ